MFPADEVQQVAPGLFFWQGYDPEVKAELSASAMVTAEGLVLIDPVPVTQEAMEEMLAEVEVRAIVVTSGNHWRFSEELGRQLQVPVLATEAAGAARPAQEVIAAGETVCGNLQVLSVDGAGPGEIALLLPGESLHLGDAVINVEPWGFSLLPDKYCTDAMQMRESLRQLAQLDFRRLFFAHGLPLVTDARRRLTQLLA